ncbi:hypothetical protein RW64_08320 [Geobacter sulfurreducens]|nr:hypothetical protein RW64_08320 [Geobacter sulfurreducens]
MRHDIDSPFRSLLPFQLGENQNDPDDASADGGRCVEILLCRDKIDTLVLERLIHVFEIDDRARETVNLFHDDRIDLPLANIGNHLLKRRPLQILPRKAFLPVHRTILPFTVGAIALQSLNLLVEGLAVLGLVDCRHPDVKRTLAIIISNFSHRHLQKFCKCIRYPLNIQ